MRRRIFIVYQMFFVWLSIKTIAIHSTMDCFAEKGSWIFFDSLQSVLQIFEPSLCELCFCVRLSSVAWTTTVNNGKKRGFCINADISLQIEKNKMKREKQCDEDDDNRDSINRYDELKKMEYAFTLAECERGWNLIRFCLTLNKIPALVLTFFFDRFHANAFRRKQQQQ